MGKRFKPEEIIMNYGKSRSSKAKALISMRLADKSG